MCIHSTQAEEGQIWGAFYTDISIQSQQFDINQITDPEVKLQLISLQDKGSGALSADKAEHVRQLLLDFIMCLNVSQNMLYLCL